MKLIEGDCLEVMRGLDDNSVDGVVTDPPYGIKMMQSSWDHGVPGTPFWSEALRVARPGAHLVAFGGTRTYHRLACAIEDAGWQIRDSLMWMYGCLSQDTEIFVDGLWTRYPDVREAANVLAYDVERDRCVVKPVERVVTYDDYDDDAFHIQAPGTDQLVSRNHRCLVDRGGKLRFEVAENLSQFIRVPIVEWADDGFKIVSEPAYVSRERYRGTMWCIEVATGAFLARRAGKIFVTGNSGFPKSHNISKSIDKTLGAERKVIGYGFASDPKRTNLKPRATHPGGAGERTTVPTITANATPEAQLFDGYGSAIKPSFEPVILAMKPLDGTFAANALTWGVAGLNIDDCRVCTSDNTSRVSSGRTSNIMQEAKGMFTPGRAPVTTGGNSGRWPPNVLLSHTLFCEDDRCSDDCPVALLDRQAPSTRQIARVTGEEPSSKTSAVYGSYQANSAATPHDKRSGASRFFPRFRYNAKVGRKERGDSTHPTMKPVAVMEWLVRLIAPPVDRPQGTPVILDPFMGSGTTGVACRRLGLEFIGIDVTPEYVEIARKRIP